jgi:hypothetical protein
LSALRSSCCCWRGWNANQRDCSDDGQPQRYVGTFVDENGGTLGAKIRQAAPDQLQLKICVLSFLCDTMKFVRQTSATQ